MNRKRRKVTTRAAALLGFALFSLAQSAWAQSNCKQAKGETVQVVNGSTISGPVTNAGDLNGTATTVFFGAAFPTNDPSTSSFTFDLTITTNQGQLKVGVVNLNDVSNGVTTGQGRINPGASTGRFAGATGFLFVSGTTTSFSPFSVQLDITGQICYAR